MSFNAYQCHIISIFDQIGEWAQMLKYPKSNCAVTGSGGGGLAAGAVLLKREAYSGLSGPIAPDLADQSN